MNTTHGGLQATHGLALKETPGQAVVATPPPAYSPRRPSAYIGQTHGVLRDPRWCLRREPSAAVLSETADEAEDQEPLYTTSSISLRINSSVNIQHSGNLVCLAETPAEHANAIAQAVVTAIQENSSGQCGIPMIDEDGRPRPIKIEVDASLVVEGKDNVVGNESIVEAALEWRRQVRRKRDKGDEDGQRQGEEEDGASNTRPKRRRTSLA